MFHECSKYIKINDHVREKIRKDEFTYFHILFHISLQVLLSNLFIFFDIFIIKLGLYNMHCPTS